MKTWVAHEICDGIVMVCICIYVLYWISLFVVVINYKISNF